MPIRSTNLLLLFFFKKYTSGWNIFRKEAKTVRKRHVSIKKQPSRRADTEKNNKKTKSKVAKRTNPSVTAKIQTLNKIFGHSSAKAQKRESNEKRPWIYSKEKIANIAIEVDEEEMITCFGRR